MPPPFILRRAVPSDAAVLARIARDAYAPYTAQIGREPAPMGADYAAHIANDRCFVAEAMPRDELGNKPGDEETVISFAVLMQKADGWWLETIATDPAHQHNGAGAALIARADAFVRDAGARGYQLYTNAVMTDAYRWYLRLGFTETRRATEDGFARIFLVKHLGAR